MKNLHDLIEKDRFDAGGRCTKIKGDVIKKLVLDTNSKLCVEIGVFKGSSLMYFAESLLITGGKIIGIDPYTMSDLKNEIPDESLNNYIYNVLFNQQEILDNLYNKLNDLIIKNDLSNTVSVVKSKSENYHTNFDKESIDILHIDGNHDEEYVTKDIQLYLPLVKKGGYIIMDDIQWPGVINAIDKNMSGAELIEDYGDFSIYKKI